MINKTIDLLLSGDETKVAEGMQSVADILPFLLIGGFSLSEIVAYLKAKLQAAKTVLSELTTENEESFLDNTKQKTNQQIDKVMAKQSQ